MKTHIMKLAMAAMFGGSMLMMTGVAGATGVAECQTALDAEYGYIKDGAYLLDRQGRTRDSLLSKVSGAKVKLDQYKPGDALQKLGDVEKTRVELCATIGTGKDKTDQDTCDTLKTLNDASIVCIQYLGQ